jgi:hypothetical protein
MANLARKRNIRKLCNCIIKTCNLIDINRKNGTIYENVVIDNTEDVIQKNINTEE